MVNIKLAFKSDRMMKALTGMTINEFNSLLPGFEAQLQIQKKIINKTKKRKRKEGAGPKPILNDPEKKLFFILFYIKCYPTFDLAGFYFNANRSQPFRWFNALLPVIEKTLNREAVLPERQINSPEEFQRKFPEIKDIFIDGTERPIQRPKKSKPQKKSYSGKKKRHTRKNIVASNQDRDILFLTPTKSGKLHDKKALDKSGLMNNIPKEIIKWFDLGFLGILADNVMMPKKKPPKGKLTLEEKQENKTISGIRVLSEHAINGPKRFRIISDVFRNHIAGIDDKAMLISCGLWNYHLRMAR